MIMGIIRRILRWFATAFTDPEEETAEELLEEEAAAPIPARAVHPLESLICTPREYRDARRAVEALRDGKIVVIRLMEVDEELGQRILDFVSGAVYLLRGSVEFLGGEILICTPDTVRVEQGAYQFKVVAMPVFRRVGT